MGSLSKSSSLNESVSGNKNRRNSASATVVSIAPTPIQPAPLTKSVPGLSTTSSVFGRQQSWSDQIADSNILKNSSSQTFAPLILASSHHFAPSSASSSASTPSNSDMKFVHSTMEILENQLKRDDAPKKKRTRTTTEQLRILQKAFQTDPMPNSSARATLSKKLGMTSRAVQVWFQNRRAKDKLDSRRQELGLPSSSFTYVKSGSEDEEDLEGGIEDDEESSVNADEAGASSVVGNTVNNNNNNNLSINEKSADFLNSLRASGMISRFAFNSSNSNSNNNNNSSNSNHSNSNNTNVKSQRSASTPNGFIQGSGGFSSSSSSNRQSTSSFMNQSAFFNSSHHHNSFLSHPLCNLFPNESFISDVTEASVDELYQDLGTGSATSPCDDSCVLSDHTGIYNLSNYSRYHFNNHSTSGDLSGTASLNNPIHNNSNNNNNNNNYFSLGDPFYGGGLIDRTPSVSPIGFGPRAPFYPVNCTYDLLIAPHSNSNNTLSNNVASSAALSSGVASIPDDVIVNASTVSACKSPASGNVFLTSSSASNYYHPETQPQSQQQRRSFSLPEAHGSLSFPQLQHLENFGLQIFPSPLLSINEEDSSSNLNGSNNKVTNFNSSSNQLQQQQQLQQQLQQQSNDLLVPFNEFLEGDVVR